ncbi:calcium-binding protein, partial [uncultured Agitococcus sp.]|uniref:calcium-binding protein n=1 Tax=uncultured Agitococcus sp. TaxID=1506599 RepID=UPI002638F895
GNNFTVSGVERLLLETGSGNDWIDNRASGVVSDEIRTGAGNDVIYGGDGADTLIGGAGNDTIDGGADGDSIDAGAGDDVITDIQAGASYSNSGTILAGSGNDSISASIRLAYSNLVIDGGEGNDSLSLMIETSSVEDNGSYGKTYYRNYLSVQQADGSSIQFAQYDIFAVGLDALKSALTTGVGYYYGEVRESPFGTIALQKAVVTGIESLSVNIVGNAGNDLIVYQNGTQYVGGEGLDTFYVDLSAESYNVNWVNDGSERTFSKQGNNFTVSGVERLLLETGSSNDFIDNAANNTNDDIRTGAGNDTLNGGAGADTLIGGTGNDLYIVDDLNDQTLENADEGLDTVQSIISWTLSNHIENLTLTGTEAINATGNDLNNYLTGNNANNNLWGALGNDTLIANAGDDTLDGGQGKDVLMGGVGNDTYFFNRSIESTGQDIVDDTNIHGNAELNTLTLTGTTLAQLTATQQANDLILAIQNSTDTITIKNFFDSNNQASYQLSLDGGVVLDK